MCVGRTLLSAAFDLDLDWLSIDLPPKVKTNFKSGGQECPPHTGLRQVEEQDFGVFFAFYY